MKWHTADVLNYEILKNNAKENRKEMTEAESVFWNFARSSGLGEKCRRQYIIDNYIVDFFFRKSMLIIELDGEYHQIEEKKLLDATRQERLECLGYKILRFKNEEILFNTKRVINTIQQHLI
ncbi:MAG: DUF559 domain-containing protein [Bacteroidales bacterium]|nr:DUF559 domain-containing protein [Bacteroidales bacterium]